MGNSKRLSGRILSSFGFVAVGVVSAFLPSKAEALNIVANFDTSINGLSNAQAVKDCINSAVGTYNAIFADNITVNLTFSNSTSGLGSNNPTRSTFSYQDYYNALKADRTTGNDNIAVANLPNQATNPVDGTTTITMTKANARAVGLSAAVAVDDVINLNTGACFTDHTTPVAGKYDLYAVACHEIDEALGTPSGLSFGTTNSWTADLFRYHSDGTRSFDQNTAAASAAFFSIDGSYDYVEYNQRGRTTGDWGDWFKHNPAQIQDWQGTQGVRIDLGPSELVLLDAIGYDLVPEPSSIVVLGLGALALIRRRKSKV